MSLNECQQCDERVDRLRSLCTLYGTAFRARDGRKAKEMDGDNFAHFFLCETTTYGHLTNIKHFNGFRCNVVGFIFMYLLHATPYAHCSHLILSHFSSRPDFRHTIYSDYSIWRRSHKLHFIGFCWKHSTHTHFIQHIHTHIPYTFHTFWRKINLRPKYESPIQCRAQNLRMEILS